MYYPSPIPEQIDPPSPTGAYLGEGGGGAENKKNS